MKSIKRILAVIALILIAAMYVVTLILAFSRSEAAGRWFIASWRAPSCSQRCCTSICGSIKS